MKGLLINKTLPSTVALACGKRGNGLINTIGTGFGVGTSVKNENTMLLATCTHVVDEIVRIRGLKKEEGVIEGFIDNLPRIALLENGSWSWKEINPEIYGVTALYEQGQINITKMDDACIIGIPGIKIPSIPLFKGKNIPNFKGNPDECVAYELGNEVMIVGFPVFVDLQTNYIAPYILKTIISCSMPVLFERDSKNRTPSPRLALGCIIGSGFSGSPVISIKEGSVIGMIDYTPYETELMDLKINKPRPIEGNVDLRYPAGVTFAIPSIVIKRSLNVINQK